MPSFLECRLISLGRPSFLIWIEWIRLNDLDFWCFHNPNTLWTIMNKFIDFCFFFWGYAFFPNLSDRDTLGLFLLNCGARIRSPLSEHFSVNLSVLKLVSFILFLCPFLSFSPTDLKDFPSFHSDKSLSVHSYVILVALIMLP